MNGPDTPGTFTPRGMDKGFIGNQIEAFAHMQALGLDIVDSLTACLQGHRMTEDLAALCIATYWRRYTAIAQYQENRGAAITLQVSTTPSSARIEFSQFLLLPWASALPLIARARLLLWRARAAS